MALEQQCPACGRARIAPRTSVRRARSQGHPRGYVLRILLAHVEHGTANPARTSGPGTHHGRLAAAGVGAAELSVYVTLTPSPLSRFSSSKSSNVTCNRCVAVNGIQPLEVVSLESVQGLSLRRTENGPGRSWPAEDRRRRVAVYARLARPRRNDRLEDDGGSRCGPFDQALKALEARVEGLARRGVRMTRVTMRAWARIKAPRAGVSRPLQTE